MAKRKKVLKHIFIPDQHQEVSDFILIGIQTTQPLYKFVYDFNRRFNMNFYLSEDIKVIRKSKEVFFENYITPENTIGQRMRIMKNEILMPLQHPNTLFDTHEAFYLFPELQAINYLLLIHKDETLNFNVIQNNFTPSYPVTWIDVDMKKCATAFPVFPV